MSLPSGFFKLGVFGGGTVAPIDPTSEPPVTPYFSMDPRAVWDFTTSEVAPFIRSMCTDARLSPGDIDLFVLHQANANIITAVMDSLGQPVDKAYVDLKYRGNTSAASVGLAACSAVDNGVLKPGDLTLLCSFGAGLTCGALLVRWCDPAGFAAAARASG